MRMMNAAQLFPHAHLSLRSGLTPLQLAERLEGVIDVKATWARLLIGVNPHASQQLKGQVSEWDFYATPAVPGRNLFLPLARGRISPEKPGATVEVEISMVPVIAWFLVLAASGLLFAGISMLSQRKLGAGIVPLVMASLVYLIPALSCQRGVHLVEAILSAALQGR